MARMPPLVGGQRNQTAHPGNVTPTLTRPLAGNPATPGLPGPSCTYSPTQYSQTVNVAVDARSLTMEVTEVPQEAERRHQLAIQQLEELRLQQTCKFAARSKEHSNDMKKSQPTWKVKSHRQSSKPPRVSQESAEAGSRRTEIETRRSQLLRDPGKFDTLDTKLLAALTMVAKRELARQILNFKETEAGERRAVRGRQDQKLFDQHLKTNEEVGSFYSVEGLLKVNLLQDDLSTFIHNWERVVAGLTHVPDERTLRDILLRQFRRSARMKWDLDLYDRAKEGTPTHSVLQLPDSEHSRPPYEGKGPSQSRPVTKSHGDKNGAPAPKKEGTRPRLGGRGRASSRDSSASFRSRSSSRGSQGRSSSPEAVCYDFLK